MYTKEYISETFLKLFNIEPRETQLEIIYDTVNSTNSSTIVNAGTGIGKSLIAVCVAHILQGGYIVAPNRILQRQYSDDPFLKKLFDSGSLAMLMGKGNYPCMLLGCETCESFKTDDCTKGKGCIKSEDDSTYMHIDRISSCSEAKISVCSECRYSIKKAEGDYKNPICWYHAARERARKAGIVIVNTAILQYCSFILVNYIKNVVIYDEAHQLDGFYRMLSKRKLFNRDILEEITPLDRVFGSHASTEEYFRVFHPDILEKIVAYRANYLDDHRAVKIPDLVLKKQDALLVYELFLSKLEGLSELISQPDERLLHDKKRYKKVTSEDFGEELSSAIHLTKKIISNIENFSCSINYYGTQANKFNIISEAILVSFMHSKVSDPAAPASKEVLLSATVFKGYTDKVLGLANAAYHEFDNGFPAAASPIAIFNRQSGAYINRDVFMPWAVESITKMLGVISERTLIHANSALNAQTIYNSFPPELKKRSYLVRGTLEYEEIKEDFAKNPTGVLISASLKEGLDLKYDLCRYIIVLTLCVPPKNSPEVLGYKNKLGLDVYNYTKATSLCQSMGRGVRAADDKARIYIMDSRAWEERKKLKKFMPPQWCRAMDRAKEIPVKTIKKEQV